MTAIVLVEVFGGVATVKRATEGVVVFIRDYDTLKENGVPKDLQATHPPYLAHDTRRPSRQRQIHCPKNW